MATSQVSSGAFRHGPIMNAVSAVAAPAGTFLPGTKVTVGSHRVIIQKYLSEGGFAHVYVVHFTNSAGKKEIAVLKRVAVPDKDALANMRTEVETMKRLKGHKNVVTYIDSHASQLKGGGYEVFLLMEYCAGGGLIDFMNTRLKNRLTEPEILKIFSDAAEGVACMHYLKPPLLHRDLKVENILISHSDVSPLYKLCDFGSAAVPRAPAASVSEGKAIEDDVQRHTTFQYRSPEMIDVYRKRAIDEKSDIWALGVLLYKLCYYTTPFEEQGQAAILSATFKYPGHPLFSDQLKILIARMLSENPAKRPNIYQVVKEVCAMRGKPVPIKDIYSAKMEPQTRGEQSLYAKDTLTTNTSSTTIGISHEKLEQPRQRIPEITPMRRGRPGDVKDQQVSSTSVKKTQGDPFAALDSSGYQTRSKAVEELSSRFPALNDFSLMQDNTQNFQFSKDKVTSKPAQLDAVRHASVTSGGRSAVDAPKSSTTRVRDDTFADLKQPINSTDTMSPSNRAALPSVAAKAKPKMVSTGTMTSDVPQTTSLAVPRPFERPIWRVPKQSDTSRFEKTLSRFDLATGKQYDDDEEEEEEEEEEEKEEPLQSISPNLSDGFGHKSPVSSRPSLEGLRPNKFESSHSLHRSRSANASSDQTRPKTSERSLSRYQGLPHRSGSSSKRNSQVSLDSPKLADSNLEGGESIESSVDYLKALERETSEDLVTHHRTSSLHALKRTSVPQLPMGSPKNILSGKFGDTFRRFEATVPSSGRKPNDGLVPDTLNSAEKSNQAIVAGTSRDARFGVSQRSSNNQNLSDTPSYSYGLNVEPDRRRNSALEITADEDLAETEDLSPEMRRELEKRRLESEERRVEAAAAEYRQRLASNGGIAPRSRATAIQDRVKNLLDESERQSPVRKTASGYGRYTTDSDALQHRSGSEPEIVGQFVTAGSYRARSQTKTPTNPVKSKSYEAELQWSDPRSSSSTAKAVNTSQLSQIRSAQDLSGSQFSSVSNEVGAKPLSTKPSAPPKPMSLRTTNTGVSNKAGLPKVDARGKQTQTPTKTTGEDLIDPESPDLELSFRQRYPQLSIEMVETEIQSSTASRRPMRIKDV